MQVIALALFGLKLIAAQSTDCPKGYWGADCRLLCGKCKADSGCNKETGACLDDTGCGNGFSGAKCMDPNCPEGHCGPEGICVSENQCVCPGLWSKNELTGACYSLRVDGLKGAGVALLVLIASILACQGGYKFAHSSSTNWTPRESQLAPRESQQAIKSVTCSRYYSCCSLMPMSFWGLLLTSLLAPPHPNLTPGSLYDLVWPLIAFTISTAYPPTQFPNVGNEPKWENLVFCNFVIICNTGHP